MTISEQAGKPRQEVPVGVTYSSPALDPGEILRNCLFEISNRAKVILNADSLVNCLVIAYRYVGLGGSKYRYG